MTTGNPNGGAIRQAIVTYNVEVARGVPTNGNIPIETRIDTTFLNSIANLTVANNYYDPTVCFNFSGSLGPNAFVVVQSAGGSIGTASCAGNFNLVTGAHLAGTTGGGASVLNCN
jgi:hypothetical protein